MTASPAATGHGRHGIFAREGILVVVGVLLPAAVSLVIGWSSLREIEADLLQQRAHLARAEAERTGDHLKFRLEPFLALAALNTPDPAGADFDRFTAALRNAWKESRLLSGGFLLAADGRPAWEDPPGCLAALPGDALAGAARAASTGKVVVTDAFVDSASRSVVLVLAPVRGEGGAVTGFAGGLLLPGRLPFTQVMSATPSGKSGSVDLVDGEGKVLHSSDPTRILGRIGGAGTAAGTGTAGSADRTGGAGAGGALATIRRLSEAGKPGAAIADEGSGDMSGAGRQVVGWAPVPNTPWAVVVRQPESEALAPVRRMTEPLAWLVPVGAILGVALAWGAARSLLQPLERLNEAADDIAGGNLSRPIPPFPDDEVGHLGRSLETMRVALKASLDEVHQANEELEARVADRTQKLARLYKELQDREEARGLLLQKVIRAQEEERKRLARELHDETCQTVAALRMGLETAREAAPDDAARARLADLEALSRRTLEDLHRLIFDLRPSVLDDLGLLPAIRWLGTKNLVPRGISVRYEFEGEDEGRLPPLVETALFRATQETLTNIVRHSKAETVLVQASIGGKEARIEIEDDGVGFEPADVAEPQESGRGLGLLGIRERLDLFGGWTTIDSSPGQGTRVVLTVPLEGGPGKWKGA